MELKDALQARAIAADCYPHLLWVMLGIRDDFHEDNDFSPTEAVFVSQLVLTGQFINSAESPSPPFLKELQTTIAAITPPPRLHYS